MIMDKSLQNLSNLTWWWWELRLDLIPGFWWLVYGERSQESLVDSSLQSNTRNMAVICLIWCIKSERFANDTSVMLSSHGQVQTNYFVDLPPL